MSKKNKKDWQYIFIFLFVAYIIKPFTIKVVLVTFNFFVIKIVFKLHCFFFCFALDKFVSCCKRYFDGFYSLLSVMFLLYYSFVHVFITVLSITVFSFYRLNLKFEIFDH